jgi:hypothetical protein
MFFPLKKQFFLIFDGKSPIREFVKFLVSMYIGLNLDGVDCVLMSFPHRLVRVNSVILPLHNVFMQNCFSQYYSLLNGFSLFNSSRKIIFHI